MAKKKLSDQDIDEMFRMEREARIAFYSSAMANFPPQQEEYKSAKKFADDMNNFAEAAADEAIERLREWEEDWEPPEEEEEDPDEREDEEEEEEEDDDRPKRGSRRGR